MSPILKILIHIFTLFVFQLFSAASDVPEPVPNQSLVSGKQPHPPKPTRLPNPLITDEGKMYICVEKELLVFENNGSISKRIPLKFRCNVDIPPAIGALGKVYLVAENRVLRVDIANTQTPEPAGEVFVGPETGHHGEEIIGLRVSIPASSVIINIKRRGLFSYRFDREIRWTVYPVINQIEYLQGCRKNTGDCYFLPVTVIDYCDASIYVANNQGELYALSITSPQFKWIQDFSSLDTNFTVTAGNNGLVYLTMPSRSIVLAVDALTGNVLWQKTVGPLSSQASAPVADNNGWVSIGSLDGYLYSISPSGFVRKFPQRKYLDSVIQVNPVLDCSGYAVYISQTKMLGKTIFTNGEITYVSAMKPLKTIFKLVVPATGTVYWSESYPGAVSNLFLKSDLRHYAVDERILLDFFSVSNTGNPLSCFSTRQKFDTSCSLMDIKKVSVYTGNEKAITLFLFYETLLLILLSCLVRFFCVFWKKKKLKNQELGKFLEKRSSLRLQKKVVDRTITELEKQKAEGTPTNEMLEKLGDLVKARDGIERKLSTTYSLGRDATSPRSESLIPLSDKKTKSFSFKTGQKESADIFHTVSGTSSEDDSGNEEKTESKGKALMEPESTSGDGGDQEETDEAHRVKIIDEGCDLQSGGASMRKRSVFFTRNVGSSK